MFDQGNRVHNIIVNEKLLKFSFNLTDALNVLYFSWKHMKMISVLCRHCFYQIDLTREKLRSYIVSVPNIVSKSVLLNLSYPI